MTPIDTLDRGADILEHYAGFISREVKADDLECHPYQPEIESVAQGLRRIAAAGKEQSDTERVIEFIRNNYQDHATIAGLCDAIRAAMVGTQPAGKETP